MSVSVIEGVETFLGKTGDGKTNEGNGKGIFKDWVLLGLNEGVGFWTEIAGMETDGEVKEW